MYRPAVHRTGLCHAYTSKATMRSGHSNRPNSLLEDAAPSDENVFCRHGDYWTVTYDGTVLHLRDTKGMRYLAALLRSPGKELSVFELLEQVSGAGCRGPGDDEAASPDTRHLTPDTFGLERARLAVTKRIKDALRTIEAHDPALGYHLGASIRTGAHCVYRPDPSRPVRWVVGDQQR